VNVIGGLQINEPALDLAIATAIASSMRDRTVDPSLAFIGEIGLSGEVRTVPQLSSRLREAAKLGFKRVIVPGRIKQEEELPGDLEIIEVRTVRAALEKAFV
jgi:DNA repair protein RadA/Sms